MSVYEIVSHRCLFYFRWSNSNFDYDPLERKTWYNRVHPPHHFKLTIKKRKKKRVALFIYTTTRKTENIYIQDNKHVEASWDVFHHSSHILPTVHKDIEKRYILLSPTGKLYNRKLLGAEQQWNVGKHINREDSSRQFLKKNVHVSIFFGKKYVFFFCKCEWENVLNGPSDSICKKRRAVVGIIDRIVCWV